MRSAAIDTARGLATAGTGAFAIDGVTAMGAPSAIDIALKALVFILTAGKPLVSGIKDIVSLFKKKKK